MPAGHRQADVLPGAQVDAVLLIRNRRCRLDRAAEHERHPVRQAAADAAHAAGVKVILYRCDDPSQLPDLKARGIDFVMTNCPGQMGVYP